eukprot:CFRG3405T1
MMNIKTVVVSSKNPVKLTATKRGFKSMFPDCNFEFQTVSVPSGVSDQPMGDDETRTGARNRMYNAQVVHPNADFWVGIEGGCGIVDDHMTVFAWVTITVRNREVVVSEGEDKSDEQRVHMYGESRTACFTLPNELNLLVKGGMELGHADDKLFERKNSKQEDGAIGLLTRSVIDRASYYEQSVILALVPLSNPDLTWI